MRCGHEDPTSSIYCHGVIRPFKEDLFVFLQYLLSYILPELKSVFLLGMNALRLSVLAKLAANSIFFIGTSENDLFTKYE